MKKLLIFLLTFLLSFTTFCYGEEMPLITEAKTHLNQSYVYATAGHDTFDCSGFTCYCYKLIEGIELLRSAQEQGYDETYPKIETIEELEKGDIVCFNTNLYDNDLSDHVGIYLGDGDFIHCSSGAGKVIISTLLEGYYNRRFSWGKRILGGVENDYNDKTRPTR